LFDEFNEKGKENVKEYKFKLDDEKMCAISIKIPIELLDK
jgi:hypothetical protein